MTPWREAAPGELCTCGRQAREVFVRADGDEIGYCGIPDGGAKSGQCPFCGMRRHSPGPCPRYSLRLPDGPVVRDDSRPNGG
jgi:hypothetical protein